MCVSMTEERQERQTSDKNFPCTELDMKTQSRMKRTGFETLSHVQQNSKI